MTLFNNISERKQEFGRSEIERVLKILSPFTPHLCEELWSLIGNANSILLEKWPEADLSLIKEEKAVLIVQVNGKVRERIEVELGISKEEAEKIVLENDRLKKWIGGKEIKEVFYVENKLINICYPNNKYLLSTNTKA